MRSFTLLHGSMLSSLAATRAPHPRVTLFSSTMGVSPISSARAGKCGWVSGVPPTPRLAALTSLRHLPRRPPALVRVHTRP